MASPRTLRMSGATGLLQSRRNPKQVKLKRPGVCARPHSAIAWLSHAAKIGNDSWRGLMTKSNKTVTIF